MHSNASLCSSVMNDLKERSESDQTTTTTKCKLDPRCSVRLNEAIYDSFLQMESSSPILLAACQRW